MAKASPRDLGSILKKLDPKYQVVLIFGRDEGMVREHAGKIGKQIVEDLNDPFNVARPNTSDLKDNPSILLDELSAISMMGGRRLVRLEGAGNESKEAVSLALTGAQGDGLLLITAGDLKPTSALRKLVEKDPKGLAIVCYEDGARDVMGLVQQVLGDAGLSATQDAVGYLVDNLGSDRMVSRGELEKLVLYMGDQSSQVTLEDAEACVGDTAALGLNQIAESVTAGNMAGLEKYIERAWTAQESPIAILRTLQSRLQRLHLTRGYIEQGMSAPDAVARLRPPVFFKEKASFTAEASRWSLPKLNQALNLVLEAEMDCKTTGNPAEVICARLLLRIAKAAK